MGLFKKLFGTYSERELRKTVEPLADKVEALEPEMQALSDEALREKTREFKDRYQQGETLDDLLPEAFAVAREGAVRVLGQRPFRTQIIGGIVLHQGRIAEMKTGEGKTLTAALPSYLNALTGRGVHVITVNDYLATYHSEWMGKLYRFLGLTVGLVTHDVKGSNRRASYAADITYGTNNEFGFDYLRDNMATRKEDQVQRGHVYCIVDEVDSILIDEARTPLIISGPGDKSTDLYQLADRFAAGLRALRVTELDAKQDNDDLDGDYVVDEKARSVTLTAAGIAKAEQRFQVENLSDPENSTLMHHINQAIRARGLMKRDVDYVVREGEVIIVDEFTGRLMFGRRYSDGLHQAIEAKEGVTVERESKTLATITFQNYFRLYEKLSGMTGTALTEEEEFRTIYKLDVIEIPTNKPMIRQDLPDVVFRAESAKYRAIIQQIKECHERQQPVLVGTVSIEKSEHLSALLKKEGIKHVVLNAKYHEKEAEIVAQAGKAGAVTIATNMAGRGTDIMLGGNADFLAQADLRKAGYDERVIADATGHADTADETVLEARKLFLEKLKAYEAAIKTEAEKVRAAGGLFIIGTERHESRRIDNQLRGRAGRQGDPGASRFFLSMEDDLMRLFGGERVGALMDRLPLEEDMPIDDRMLSGVIESAQRRLESRNFQTRKTVLEFDDVMNRQRSIIYQQRKQVLEDQDLRSTILSMIDKCIDNEVARYMGESLYPDAVQVGELERQFLGQFLNPGEFHYSEDALKQQTRESITQDLKDRAHRVFEAREKALGEDLARKIERFALLTTVDQKWMDHIDAMQELRQGIYLRSYGQQRPIDAYTEEGFSMFEAMVSSIQEDTVRLVYTLHPKDESQVVVKQHQIKLVENVGGTSGPVKKKPVRRSTPKIGRNDPCPCGSGKKYKHCCLLKEGGAGGAQH